MTSMPASARRSAAPVGWAARSPPPALGRDYHHPSELREVSQHVDDGIQASGHGDQHRRARIAQGRGKEPALEGRVECGLDRSQPPEAEPYLEGGRTVGQQGRHDGPRPNPEVAEGSGPLAARVVELAIGDGGAAHMRDRHRLGRRRGPPADCVRRQCLGRQPHHLRHRPTAAPAGLPAWSRSRSSPWTAMCRDSRGG